VNHLGLAVDLGDHIDLPLQHPVDHLVDLALADQLLAGLEMLLL